MHLPSRAKPLLERLDLFLESPAMAPFRAAATSAFLGEDRAALDDELPFVDDYALFEFRDAQGRSMLDLFFAAQGAALPPGERAAFERMRTTFFGGFQVDAVRPGSGFRARRCGTQERYEVVDIAVSAQVKPGDCFLCRLIPFGDRHEIAGSYCLAFDRTFAYVIDRATEHAAGSAPMEIFNPRTYFDALRRRGNMAPHAKTRLEAELFAGQVFAEVGYPRSVEEVQARFQTMTGIKGILADRDLPPFENEDALQRFMSAIQSLWNFTPRDEFGGKSPAEKHAEHAAQGRRELPEHLIADLTLTVQREMQSEKYEKPSDLRHATDAAVARWMQTPQKALGGISPARYLGHGVSLQFPSVAGLPPRDRPVWTAESLEAKAADLAEHGRVHGLLWVTDKLERLGASALGPVPRRGDGPGDARRARTPRLFTEQRTAIESVIDSVCAAMRASGSSISPHGVSAALGRVDATALKRFLTDLILLEAPSEQSRWLEALIQLGAAENLAPIRALCAATSSSDVAELALVYLTAHDTPEAVTAAVNSLLELYADQGIGPDEAGAADLCCRFDFLLPLEWSDDANEALVLFGKPPPHHGEDWRQDFAFLRPHDDPAARERARTMITEKRVRQLMRMARDEKRTSLIAMLGTLVQEATTAACRTHPRFKTLGENLHALAATVAAHRRLDDLTEEAADELALLLASCLAMAIRGRDMRAEISAAHAGTVPWLELLAVDLPWMTGALSARMKTAVGQEDALTLWNGKDAHVREHAALLLADMAPERHAGKLLDVDLVNGEHCMDIAEEIIAARGDAFLDAYCAELARLPAEEAARHLLPFAACAGTERGRIYVDRALEPVLTNGFFWHTLRMLLELADHPMARKVVDLVRQGRVDRSGFWAEYSKRDSLAALRTLIEVHALDADAEQVLAEGSAAFLTREEAEIAERERAKARTSAAADDAIGPPPIDTVAPRPPTHIPLESKHLRDEFVIHRDEHKVGRNDPCPCGSGKKYKNCCG